MRSYVSSFKEADLEVLTITSIRHQDEFYLGQPESKIMVSNMNLVDTITPKSQVYITEKIIKARSRVQSRRLDNLAEQLIRFLHPTCLKFSQVFLIITDILVPDPAARGGRCPGERGSASGHGTDHLRNVQCCCYKKLI